MAITVLLINATEQNLQGARWREFSMNPHVKDCGGCVGLLGPHRGGPHI